MDFVIFPKSWIPSPKLLLPEWARAMWSNLKEMFGYERRKRRNLKIFILKNVTQQH